MLIVSCFGKRLFNLKTAHLTEFFNYAKPSSGLLVQPIAT